MDTAERSAVFNVNHQAARVLDAGLRLTADVLAELDAFPAPAVAGRVAFIGLR